MCRGRIEIGSRIFTNLHQNKKMPRQAVVRLQKL